MGYKNEYRRSLQQPEAFWAEQAGVLDWFRSPATVLEVADDGTGRWFGDGELNTAWLALDAHVEAGRGETTALIYDSPVTGTVRSYTFAALRDAVARFAGALRGLGVGRGDRVLIYMPMVPEAAIAMLACARLGAVHSVVFGGFAPHELTMRIDDAEPTVVVSASCGIEVDRVIEYKPMLDAAIAQCAHPPRHCVILQREQAAASLVAGRDVDFDAVTAAAEPADCVPVAATDPLYILYTSGTTGKPKGVVRDNGGHAVALNYSMRAIYGMAPGEVFWAASDVGWVVGHSYIVYGPLIAGCTSILYEGKPVRTPDAGAFWRVIEQHGVKAVFAAPTAFRAIRKEDPTGKLIREYDLDSLKTLFLAGERLDPATYHWLREHFERPVIDHWWQTETGWPVAANPVGLDNLPTRPGSPSFPVPGYDIRILDEAGAVAAVGQEGAVTLKLPLPPGCLTTIWRNPARFEAGYLAQHPGHYTTGDGGYFDEDGYLYIMGRIDDIINVAGHRLSTGEMEQVVAAHPDVAECAVIGIADELRGQVPLALVCLKEGADTAPAEIERQVVSMVREEVGAVACLRQAVVVERLPKTRSGKILRAVLRKVADRVDYNVPSTIDDPAILGEIAAVLAERQIGGQSV